MPQMRVRIIYGKMKNLRENFFVETIGLVKSGFFVRFPSDGENFPCEEIGLAWRWRNEVSVHSNVYL